MAKENENLQKNLENKYVEFQMLEQQLRQIQADVQNVDSQLIEIKSMQNAIAEMQNIKEGSEILVPIVNGMFVKGTITDAKKIFVNVGSNIAIDKNIPESIELLEKQLREISALRQQFLDEMNRTGAKMQLLEAELQKLVSEEGH